MKLQPPSGTDLRERLQAGLHRLGMDADPERMDALLAYVALLERWNRVYNLTAVRTPEAMLVRHVFDCLSVMPLLRVFRAGGDAYVADIGSGAGLPGIIVAICEPRWRVDCVDAVEKKAAFIRQAAGALGLHNVHAVHGRAEVLAPLDADIVISRAFASLADFVRIAGRHRAPGGRLFAMKGQYPEEERRMLESETGWVVQRHVPLDVPEMADAQRCVLELCPKDLPRP